MKQIKLILLIVLTLFIVGCEEIVQEEENLLEQKEEQIDPNQFEENQILNDSEESFLTFNEFKKITQKGFDNIVINEETYCYEFETYDEEYDECVTELDCDEELGECEEFDKIYEEFLMYLDNQDYTDENVKVHHHSENQDNDLTNEYFISDDDTLQLVKGEHSQVAKEMFKEFSKLIPKKYREDLDYYGEFTDGLENTLAYVSQRNYEKSPEIWYIAIDSTDYKEGSKKEFIHTLIHEFGHILSLQQSQIDYENFGDCKMTLLIQEGCLKSNSYLLKFHRDFWYGEVSNYHNQLVDKYGEEEEAGYELYNKYSNQFVSDYAATNVVEDFAESFTIYVLSSNLKIESSIDKVQFFNQFEELKELRAEIRSNLDKNKRKFKNN